MESRNKEITSNEDNLTINEQTSDKAAEDNTSAAFNSDNNNQPDVELDTDNTVQAFEGDFEDGDEEKKPKEPFFKRFIHSPLFTKPFKGLCFTFLFAVLVYLVSRFIPAFAEFWSRYPAQGLRFVLAKLTGWIPFSLAEVIIVSIPVLAIGYIVGSTVSTKRDESDENFYRWMRPVVSIILVILTLFLSAFAPAYSRYTLAKNLGLERKEVSADELYSTAVILSELSKECLAEIDYDTNGASIMPYSYNELVDKVNAAFDKYAEDADYISHFNSNPKAIALSKPMTYTHISGVYTFMTGESNINTNYPDFLMPFTMAHEMAHQRGIAREDEANFVAFLVCIGSDDAYIRYSGYANMLNYLMDALGEADINKYVNLLYVYLPTDITREFVAYEQFFTEYRDSVASEVTGTVNNTHLQLQGQKAGTKSYGLVVDLAVAYYKK